MKKITLGFLAAAASIVATPGKADIHEIEKYLVGAEGTDLRNKIKDLKGKIRASESGNVFDDIGTCPVKKESPSTEAYLLLLGDNEAERDTFYQEYGSYLDLPMAFDPDNSYHMEIDFKRTNIAKASDSIFKRSNLSETQKNELLKFLMQDSIFSPYEKIENFWPPELSNDTINLTQDDLKDIFYSADTEMRTVISNLLMPRAKLTLQMLEDKAGICTATDDQKVEATQRATNYFSPKGL